MHEYRLLEHLQAHGLLVDTLEAGRLVRCRTADKPRKLNGWYIAFLGDIPTVVWGNWATGDGGKFLGLDRPLTQKERATVRVQYEQSRELARREQVKRYEENRQAIQTLIRDSQPIGGTVAERYLKNRGIECVAETDALLYTPRCFYSELGKSYYLPALLGVFTDPTGANVLTVQRIYLTDSGHKADVLTPKKLMPICGDTSGGSVKIGRPTNGKHGAMIGVAEGIETALSASQLNGVAVWATLGTAWLKSFIPPNSVREVVIFTDNDTNGAGQRAGDELGARLAGMGIFAKAQPPIDGVNDWNDVLQQVKKTG